MALDQAQVDVELDDIDKVIEEELAAKESMMVVTILVLKKSSTLIE